MKSLYESILDTKKTSNDLDWITSFGSVYELVDWNDKNTKKSSCLSIPKLKKLTKDAKESKGYSRWAPGMQEYAALFCLWLENINLGEIGFTNRDLSDKSNWDDFAKTIKGLIDTNKISKGKEFTLMWSDGADFRVRIAVSTDTFPKYLDFEYRKL